MAPKKPSGGTPTSKRRSGSSTISSTVLAHTDYHRVAEGFGGTGILLDDPAMIPEALTYAREAASSGHPVLINAILGKTDFRKGSISM